MWDYLRTEHIKCSKKEYFCDGCFLLINAFGISNVKNELSAEDLVVFERLESKKFKIQKGDSYMKIVGVYDGEIQVSRFSSDELYKIAEKHNCFDID